MPLYSSIWNYFSMYMCRYQNAVFLVVYIIKDMCSNKEPFTTGYVLENVLLYVNNVCDIYRLFDVYLYYMFIPFQALLLCVVS